MKFTIDLDDMVHFKQRIDSLSDWEQKVMRDAAGVAEDRLLLLLKTYPTQQRRKLPTGIPKSRAQARKIAMLFKTGQVPYKRTGGHAGGWTSQVKSTGASFEIDLQNMARGVENIVTVTPTGKGISKTRMTTKLKGYYARFLRAPQGFPGGGQYRMFRGYWANLDTILKEEGKFIRDTFREAAAWLGKNLVRK